MTVPDPTTEALLAQWKRVRLKFPTTPYSESTLALVRSGDALAARLREAEGALAFIADVADAWRGDTSAKGRGLEVIARCAHNALAASPGGEKLEA